MIQEYQIRILPEQAASEEGIKRYLAKEKGLDVRTLNQVRVLKRSIDARQRTIFVNLKVRAYINEFPQDDQYVHTEYPDVSSRPRVIVVGEGPGGLFRSEEHTSELQSRFDLACRLLLEKKKNTQTNQPNVRQKVMKNNIYYLT